jgi:hypothetical protein
VFPLLVLDEGRDFVFESLHGSDAVTLHTEGAHFVSVV